MGGTRPTVSQAEAWRPESLRDAAHAWDAAATDVTGRIDVAVRAVQATRDFWTGEAADAARQRAAQVSAEADTLARALVAAAAAARTGAEHIAAAQRAVLDAVAVAEAAGLDVADDGTVTPSAPELTAVIVRRLDALGAADDDAAGDIDAAFHPVSTTTATRPAAVDSGASVAAWPHMSQDNIADQIAAMTPEQRRRLIEDYPTQVGNTDGVPWDMRTAANRINVAQAVVDESRKLDRPVEEKLRDVMRHSFPDWSTERGGGLTGPMAERVWAVLHTDAATRERAIADLERPTRRRITFYQSLLDGDRQVLAFEPHRSSFVELIGDLGTAKSVGVLVPGLNTTIEGSAADTATARRFVEAGHGDVAMITYLGGPFPQGDIPGGVIDAASSHYALDMAPRLVAFSEDVNRVVDATGRDIAVTYIGHSYGGSILGTAESLGLTADRTLYVEAAGAGVGVGDPSDWHNRNPNVTRFSMTAPGDLIEAVQGMPFGPHGADPDNMPGVIRLDTGYYDDGRLVAGPNAHSDVLNKPSDAWRNILAVITGGPVTVYRNPLRRWAG